MVIVTVLLWKQARPLTMTGIALSLILGGAVGNLWDRVASGRVVDFLLFYVKTLSVAGFQSGGQLDCDWRFAPGDRDFVSQGAEGRDAGYLRAKALRG